MNILIIVCNSKADSFNHAISDVVVKTFENEAHQVILHDLYAEQFNPILTQEEIDSPFEQCDPKIQSACIELAQADIIVIIHPNWWGQPPALIKGWLDRVVRTGIAYKFTDKGAVGLLKAKKAFIFNTSNTPEIVEMNVYGDPLDNLWKKCIFNMCGVLDVERKMFKGVITSSENQRLIWLNEVRESLKKIIME